MMTTFDEIADHIWRRPGEGPKLAIVGSVHGDEEAGARVVAELLEADDRVWRRAGAVDLTLAVGNPRALVDSTRHTLGGSDLNRIFGETAPGQETDYERSRASVLEAHLGDVDLLLDLHQTSCSTPPVAVIHDSPSHLRWASSLGVAHAVVDIERVFTGTTLGRWIDARGGVGLTVETGRKGEQEALDAAREIARRFLTAGGNSSAARGRIRRYRLEEAWACPGPGLRFARPLGNTSRIRGGELLGHYDDGELRAPRDAVVFLPREGASVGSPCMLLATDEGIVTV